MSSKSTQPIPLLERATNFFIVTSQSIDKNLKSHRSQYQNTSRYGKQGKDTCENHGNDGFIHDPIEVAESENIIIDETLKADLFPKIFKNFILTEVGAEPLLNDSQLEALGILLYKSMIVRNKSLTILNQIKSGFRLVYDTFYDRFRKVGKQDTNCILEGKDCKREIYIGGMGINTLSDYDDEAWSRMARVLAPLLDFRDDLRPKHLEPSTKESGCSTPTINSGRFNLTKFCWIIESLERSKTWSKVAWKEFNVLDGRGPLVLTLIQLFTESRYEYSGVVQYNEHELRELLKKLDQDKKYENELRKSESYKHYYKSVPADSLNLFSLSNNYRRMFKNLKDPNFIPYDRESASMFDLSMMNDGCSSCHDCHDSNDKFESRHIKSPHKLQKKAINQGDEFRPRDFDYILYNYFNRKVANFGYLYQASIFSYLTFEDPVWTRLHFVYTHGIRFAFLDEKGLDPIISVFNDVRVRNFKSNNFKTNLQKLLFHKEVWHLKVIEQDVFQKRSEELVHRTFPEDYSLMPAYERNHAGYTEGVKELGSNPGRPRREVESFYLYEDSSWEFLAWLCQLIFKFLIKDAQKYDEQSDQTFFTESDLIDENSPWFKNGILKEIISSSISYLYRETISKDNYSLYTIRGHLRGEGLEIYKTCFQSEILIALDGLYYKIGASKKGVQIFCLVFDLFFKLKIISRKMCLSHYTDKSEKYLQVQRRNRGLFNYEREVVFKSIKEFYKKKYNWDFPL